MKQYHFDEVISRDGTFSVKTDADIIAKLFDLNVYEDTISMWVADMDFSPPPELLEAIHDRLERKIIGYTFTPPAYYDAIIDWYKRRHQMNIQREWLIYSPGTVAATRNLIRTVTLPGEKVIIQPPVYYPFKRQILETGRQVAENQLLLQSDGSYHIDLEDFERHCRDPETSLFILCNPHNPVGQIWREDILNAIIEICNRHNVTIFSDEIHCDLIRDGAHFTSLLNLSTADDASIIVATAANKTFNVAGLHLTNLVIPSLSLRKKFIAEVGKSNINPGPIAIAATIAAYEQGESWVKELNAVIDNNVRILDDFIRQNLPKIRFQPPEGTYLAWLDCRDIGISERELLVLLAEKAHVILEPGSLFGEEGEGFLRINVACPGEVLREALRRIGEAMACLEGC